MKIEFRTLVVLLLLGHLLSPVVLAQTPDAFNPGANNSVWALAVQTDGQILAGGCFGGLGGGTRSNMGRLASSGTLDPGFTPTPLGNVYCLAMQPDGRILAGGNFISLNNVNCNGIGRLNTNGSLDTGFNAGPYSMPSAYVNALSVQADGKILVGGIFPSLGGLACTNLVRLNTNGTSDTSFCAVASSGVYALAVQGDGKILAGGTFSQLNGQTRTCLGRLNTNGTLDASLNVSVGGLAGSVYCLALQPDGKILVGGNFTSLNGQSHTNIGRLNSDGTTDGSFNAQASGTLPFGTYHVYSLSLQADGRIMVGGDFMTLNGQACTNLGRLNTNGTLDASYNVSVGGVATWVYSLALQADGKLLVGGWFATLGGLPRVDIGRLNNTDAATQSLTFGGTTIAWLRGGTSPEVWRTTFESSSDGTNWTSLGAGTRVAGGWQLSGVSVPDGSFIRARGAVAGGECNGSGWFVESTAQVAAGTPPVIFLNDGCFGFRTNQFGFNVGGRTGQVLLVEASSNLSQWTTLVTNTLGGSSFYFSDSCCTNFCTRFYRVRLQ